MGERDILFPKKIWGKNVSQIIEKLSTHQYVKFYLWFSWGYTQLQAIAFWVYTIVIGILQLRNNTTNKVLRQCGEYIVLVLQNSPIQSISSDAPLLRPTLSMIHLLHIVLITSFHRLKICPLFLQVVYDLEHLLIYPEDVLHKTSGLHPSIIATHTFPSCCNHHFSTITLWFQDKACWGVCW